MPPAPARLSVFMTACIIEKERELARYRSSAAHHYLDCSQRVGADMVNVELDHVEEIPEQAVVQNEPRHGPDLGRLAQDPPRCIHCVSRCGAVAVWIERVSETL